MDDDENLSMLLSMGFPDIGEIKRALRLAKNDVNEAVAILTNEQPLSSYGPAVDDLTSVDIDMRDLSSSADNNTGGGSGGGGLRCSTSTEIVACEKNEAEDEDEFPVANLYELEQRVFQDNWSIPYKREESLGRCLTSASVLSRNRGSLIDEDENIRKFFDRVMPAAFNKLMTSTATYGWQAEIQEGILTMSELLVDLALARLPHEPVPLSIMEVLKVAFDVENGWNNKNKDQISNSSNCTTNETHGWLCDLVNRFADGGGMSLIDDCFKRPSTDTRGMEALLRPLANCSGILKADFLQKHLDLWLDKAFDHVERMGEAELRSKEVTAVSDMLVSLKVLCQKGRPDCVEECDKLRLDMICKMLRTPQFNTRMNALKEVSRLIEESGRGSSNKRPHIGPDRLVEWMADNRVLTVALEGNIDQVQYTDRIKAIVEFLGPRLSTDDLGKMWHLQDSPNSHVMDNVYAIMASAAAKLSLVQFEHLTGLIKTKWETSNDRVREKLLVLIGQIGREAKPIKSIQAILQLLWEVSHLDLLPRHLVERALDEQLAILTEMTLNRDGHRRTYILHCVEDIKRAQKAAVLPALNHLHRICKSYSRGSSPLYQKADKATLADLNRQHEIVKLLSMSIRKCHRWAVDGAASKGDQFKADTLVDGRYTHEEYVNGHLDLMKFFLKEGDLYLSWGRCKGLWETLVDNPNAIEFDRQVCFGWFQNCLTDLESETQQDFFKQRLLHLPPAKVSTASFDCYKSFLEIVNANMGNLRKSQSPMVIESLDLIGFDYLWNLITDSPKEHIADAAIDYFLDLSFLLVSPKLKKDTAKLHQKFIQSCYQRLEAVVELPTEKQEAVQEGCEVETSLRRDDKFKGEPDRLLTAISVSKVSTLPINAKGLRLQKIRRLILLAERYISAIEEAHTGNRVIFPHAASFHGQPLRIKVVYEPKKDEFNLDSHTNERVCDVKRKIADCVRHALDELHFQSGDIVLGSSKDQRLVGCIGEGSDPQTWVVKMQGHATTSSSSSTAMVVYQGDQSSSPTSSTSTDNRQTFWEEQEKSLPGVLMADGGRVFTMLYQLANLNDASTLRGIRRLVHLIPTDPGVIEALEAVSYHSSSSPMASAEVSPKLSPRSKTVPYASGDAARRQLSKLFDAGAEGMSPFRVLYNLEVLSGRLMPTHGQEVKCQQQQAFSQDFLHAGGLRLILNVFEKDSLPVDIDYDVRQSTYLVALQLAGYLLCGQTVTQNCLPTYINSSSNPTTSPIMKPTPPKKSALDVTSASVNASGKSPVAVSASKIVQTMLESEFSDTVSCLIRVVWSAAAGNLQLASSNMPTDAYTDASRRFYASRRSRDSSTGSSTGSTASDSGGGGNNDNTELHAGVCSLRRTVNRFDAQIAGQAFDLLVTCLSLRSNNISSFYSLPLVADFIIETLLGSPSEQVRSAACEQLIRLARVGVASSSSAVRALNMDQLPEQQQQQQQVKSMSPKQFLTKTLLKTPVPLWMPSCKARGTSHTLLGQCSEYFALRCHLLRGLSKREQDVLGEDAQHMIEDELTFLHNYAPCQRLVDCTLLAGHLRLVCALLSADGVSRVDVGANLIEELLYGYLFPSSRLIADGALNGGSGEVLDLAQARDVNPKCDTPDSRVAAYNLLVELARDCPENMTVIVASLIRMHHSYNEVLAKDFEYEPPVDRRATCNFVGLKNAGATCYMNSVLQQLFNVPGVHDNVLSVDLLDDVDGDSSPATVDEETVFCQLQNVFGHLMESKLQHYIPDKFWRTFRLFGQPVNVREQQDAFEFFTQIVDQVDEFLAARQKPKIFSRHFEGIFSDQKLCQGCPHRYEREQSFMALNLTVKSNNLQESLDQFVRGELLEGDNAYFCEKCQEKRHAIKRMCIRTLPHTLVIQLKRFHYDWETNRAVKFDDYFQFPWTLEMGPYTAEGIRRAEAEQTEERERRGKKHSPRKLSFSKTFMRDHADLSHPYDLVGVVVHSGQANAGHYYSYIKERRNSTNSKAKWFKFNDTTVEEFHMTDEALAQECFGGSYKVKKHGSCTSTLPENRQRYWNAYMLFYEARDVAGSGSKVPKKSQSQTQPAPPFKPGVSPRKTSTPAGGPCEVQAPRESLSQLSDLLEKGEKKGLFKRGGGHRMPSNIERGIQEENLRFLQNRDVFCDDYYRFVVEMVGVNERRTTFEVLAVESVKLCVHFLLNSYCHVKRRQRTVMSDLLDSIEICAERSPEATNWLANFLGSNEGLQYLRPFLLECCARGVRGTFSQLVDCCLRNLHRHVGTTETDDVNRLMATLVALIENDVANHIKTSGQFFALLAKFACMGVRQCRQLFQLNAFRNMIKLLLGVEPDPDDDEEEAIITARQRGWTVTQCRDFGELHCAMAYLIMSCDTKSFRSTPCPDGIQSVQRSFPEPLGQMPTTVSSVLYGRLSSLFIRESVCACREVCSSSIGPIIDMLVHVAYCNARFSQKLLEELMKQYNNVNSGELKNLSTLLIETLTLSDPLQSDRLRYAIDGDESIHIDGLLALVNNNQTADSCRAYQCIKTLVAAANKSAAVKERLLQDPERWQWAVNWLKDKMDTYGTGSGSGVSAGGPGGTGNMSGGTYWTSPSTSNEDSLSRTFHRTTSAQVTLEEANALLAEFDRPSSAISSKNPPPSPPDAERFMDTEEKNGGNNDDDDMPDLQELDTVKGNVSVTEPKNKIN